MTNNFFKVYLLSHPLFEFFSIAESTQTDHGQPNDHDCQTEIPHDATG